MNASVAEPMLILDGAHNIGAVEALCGSIKTRVGGLYTVIVAGIMKDKSCREMVNALNNHANAMVYTMPLYRSRACDPAELYRMTDNKQKCLITESDPIRAVELAKKLCGPNGCVIVCGSLYLVGDIKRQLLIQDTEGGCNGTGQARQKRAEQTRGNNTQAAAL
jgi:dihydrofolate synthase/folylpolyglutamate synthase